MALTGTLKCIVVISLTLSSVSGFSWLDILGFTFRGCYRDGSSRDITGESTELHNNNPNNCFRYCDDLNKGYNVIGVQYGKQCFCGKDFGKYGEIAVVYCDRPCPGDAGMMCGGSWANSVFTMGTGPTLTLASFLLGHVGCYSNNLKSGLLSEYIHQDNGGVDECINTCKSQGYSYAAVQDREFCVCGNSYGSAENVRPISDCNQVCPSQSERKCGGRDTANVYDTNYSSDFLTCPNGRVAREVCNLDHFCWNRDDCYYNWKVYDDKYYPQIKFITYQTGFCCP